MKVAINALCADNRSGTGYYARGLLAGLASLTADGENPHDVVTVLPDSYQPAFNLPSHWHLLKGPSGGAPARIAWEEFQLPSRLARLGVDLCHGPAFVVPRRWRGPSVVTIHDAAFLRYPETISWLKRLYYNNRIPASARQARAVVTDSQFAAREIQECMGIPADGIEAVPLGVDHRFRAVVSPEQRAAVRREHHLPETYLLFVGVIEPRKNLATLIQAYARARQQGLDIPLVMAGRSGWKNRDIFELPRQLGIESHVHFPGYIPDTGLPALYANAQVFVYPSLYEGFGLPVLEAMAAGCPVLVSDAGALRELAGDAGRSVPALGVEAWAEALRECGRNADRRAAMAEAGRKRSAAYTWEETARQTLVVYEKALASA